MPTYEQLVPQRSVLVVAGTYHRSSLDFDEFDRAERLGLADESELYDHDRLLREEDTLSELDRLFERDYFEPPSYRYDESDWEEERRAQEQFLDVYLPPQSSREQIGHRKEAILNAAPEADLFDWPPPAQKKRHPQFIFRSKHWRRRDWACSTEDVGDFNSDVLDAFASADSDNDEFFVLSSMGFSNLAHSLST